MYSKQLKKLLYRMAWLTRSLSLKWDPSFVPNLIICIGVVFIWRGMRNIIDEYFFPEYHLFSNIVAIGIWMFLLYLPDSSYNSFSQLWWVRSNAIHKHERQEKDAKNQNITELWGQ
jgi:hypothetical protein